VVTHSSGSSSTAAPPELREQLQQLDKLLQRDGVQEEAQATGLASSLAEGGALRAFGKARQARAGPAAAAFMQLALQSLHSLRKSNALIAFLQS
jgi:hypothetical protein